MDDKLIERKTGLMDDKLIENNDGIIGKNRQNKVWIDDILTKKMYGRETDRSEKDGCIIN